MFTTFECILIQIKDPLGEFDGYDVRNALIDKYDVLYERIHYTAEDQVIITLPEKYGVPLGVSMNEIRETVNNITEATVHSVAINVDYQNQQIEAIHIY